MLAPQCTGRAKLLHGFAWMVVQCSMGCSDSANDPVPNDLPTCLDADVHPTDAPGFPLVHETEHLDVFVDVQGFMCAGTANELERFTNYVTDQLDVELQRRIPVYYASAINDHCPPGTIGCVKKDGVVFSTALSSQHELVHGITCETRVWPPALISEGLAVSFEPVPNDTRGDPRDLSELSDADFHAYAAAGHFVRWLQTQLGAEAFMHLYATAEYETGVWAAIEAAYGAAVSANYLAQAPALWVPHRQCADLPVLEPDAGAWTFDLHFDCDDPGTMGPYERTNDSLDANYMYQSFLINVEAPGLHRFERPDWERAGFVQVRVERCLGQHPMTQQEVDEQWIDDWIWFDFQHQAEFKFSHAGPWRVDVLREFGPPADVWLTIEPQE